MTPRFLRYLRLNDEPPTPRDDLVSRLPVEIEDLNEWFKFCTALAQQRQWQYELLTIDFNFKSDLSGPWFPFPNQDPREYNADFLGDPLLAQLQWSNRLSDVGPNSGLLIGSQLVSHSAYRDLPCGVAFHTYHPEIVIRDMSSAMLITQILLASGATTPAWGLRETMRAAVDLVRSSSGRPLLGLGDAVSRFRQAFLQRTGAVGSRDAVRLWMEPSSLSMLLNTFRSVQTEEELDQTLQQCGIEFYDRTGALESLDLRSVFLDRLFYQDKNHVLNLLPFLRLIDVKSASEGQPEPGIIWQFISTLGASTPEKVDPTAALLRRLKKEQGEVKSKTAKRKSTR
jgi:hypothetical protein